GPLPGLAGRDVVRPGCRPAPTPWRSPSPASPVRQHATAPQETAAVKDLWAALCLVAVLEGLLLFIAPRGWKQAMQQLQALPERHLRIFGGLVAGLGLLALLFVRGHG